MKASDRGYFAPLAHDLRVRERMLAAGVVTPTEIQQYLAGLPDHESHYEALTIPQPALAAPQPPAPPPALPPIRVAAPIAVVARAQAIDDADDDDDEEDDDEEDDDDLDADEPAAAVAAPVEAVAKHVEADAAPAQSITVGEPVPTGAVHETNEAASIPEEAAPVEAAPVEAAPVDVAPPVTEAAIAAEPTNATTEEHTG